MIHQEVKRLWRVSWVHRNGYRSPDKFVWAKLERRMPNVEKRFVIEWAKTASRLSYFPDQWYFTVEPMEVYDPKDGAPRGAFSFFG